MNHDGNSIEPVRDRARILQRENPGAQAKLVREGLDGRRGSSCQHR